MENFQLPSISNEVGFPRSYLTYFLISIIVAHNIDRKPTIANGSLFRLLNSAIFTNLPKSCMSYILYNLSCRTTVSLIVNSVITLIFKTSNSYLRAISLALVWILFPTGKVFSVVIEDYFKMCIYTSNKEVILNTSIVYLVVA